MCVFVCVCVSRLGGLATGTCVELSDGEQQVRVPALCRRSKASASGEPAKGI